MNKHILIAGAGLSGAVIARELAEKNFKVSLFEKNDHIAGQCHTVRDAQTGIMLHSYGPHIFHTEIPEVWEYVNRYASFKPFINRVKAVYQNRVYSLPVNLHTINQIFSRSFSPREAAEYINQIKTVYDHEPLNFEEQALSLMGEELYKAFFRGYTIKQWGRNPVNLPASILKRLPFSFNYNDNYFNHKYQGIPELGYTAMCEAMLDHPNISLILKRAFTINDERDFHHVFYTGPIDQYFSYKFGRLQYRTLDFEKFYPDETLDGDYQGCAVMNYCDESVPFTRITEHKHFTPWETHKKTVCYREYSRECGETDTPYYPVRLTDRQEILDRYLAAATQEKKTTFIGRLAEYKYIDMDVTVKNALDSVNNFLMQ